MVREIGGELRWCCRASGTSSYASAISKSWRRPLFDGEEPQHQQHHKLTDRGNTSSYQTLRGRKMSDLPTRPPALAPPLAAGWTEHKAPSGSYSFAASLGQS